jgi:hypothetical protein
MVVRGEKLDGVLQIGQPTCWRCSEEFSFLGSSDSVQLCRQLHEILLYMNSVRYVWSMAIHGLSVESVWRVGWIPPYMVYIDSNHRDSRI